jgi:hypothetical protein
LGVATYQVHPVLQGFLAHLNDEKREEWWRALSTRGTGRFFQAGLLWVSESANADGEFTATSNEPDDYVWRVKARWLSTATCLDRSPARIVDHEPRHVRLVSEQGWRLEGADLFLPPVIECVPDFPPRGTQWVELVPAVRSDGITLVIEANKPTPRAGDRLRVAGTLWHVVEWSPEPEECRLGNGKGGTTWASRLVEFAGDLRPRLLGYEGDEAIFVIQGEQPVPVSGSEHDMEPVTIDALTVSTQGPFVVLELRLNSTVMEWTVMAQAFELLDVHRDPDRVQLRVRLRSSMLLFLEGLPAPEHEYKWNVSDGDSYGPRFDNEPEFECTQMEIEDVFAIRDVLKQAIQIACSCVRGSSVD